MWDGKGDVNEYLEHHGVVGMKWGIRKANYSTVRSVGASKLQKLENKQAKATKIKTKAAKYNYKSAKHDYKNMKRKAKGKPEKITKAQLKASKLTMKANKIDMQINKLDRKVTKLADIASKKEVDMKAADRWEELFDRRVADVGR